MFSPYFSYTDAALVTVALIAGLAWAARKTKAFKEAKAAAKEEAARLEIQAKADFAAGLEEIRRLKEKLEAISGASPKTVQPEQAALSPLPEPDDIDLAEAVEAVTKHQGIV